MGCLHWPESDLHGVRVSSAHACCHVQRRTNVNTCCACSDALTYTVLIANLNEIARMNVSNALLLICSEIRFSQPSEPAGRPGKPHLSLVPLPSFSHSGRGDHCRSLTTTLGVVTQQNGLFRCLGRLAQRILCPKSAEYVNVDEIYPVWRALEL